MNAEANKQQEDKKREERRHVERLARIMPEEFDREWKDGPEPPDFHCETSNGRIGLELTHFHHDDDMNSSYQRWRDALDKLGSACIKALRQRGIEADVSLMVDHRFDAKRDFNALKSYLVRCALCYMPATGASINVGSRGSMPLPACLSNLGVMNMRIRRGERQSNWDAPYAWV